MAKKRAASAKTSSDRYFVKELAGETPPSFPAMKRLYELASDLYHLRPWRVLEESQLVLIRDSVSGELNYCAVMGSGGESYSMHVYLGAAGFRQFRKIHAGELTDPNEFLASMHCVYVDFVPGEELEPPDQELLTALGHPKGKDRAAPIFRTIRPGFYPWFITADEARILAQGIQAIIVASSVVAEHQDEKLWEQADTYPLITRMEGTEPQFNKEVTEPQFKLEMVQVTAPTEPPPPPPVQLDEEKLRTLRNQDYAVRGVMELDHFLTGAPIGEEHERQACASIALAVDAENGSVLAPKASDTTIAVGDAMAQAFIKAIESTRTLPNVVNVRNRRLKNSLAPLMDFFGVKVEVASRLPAADQARSSLLAFMQGGAGKK
jgi:hypothetical protein